MVEREEEKKKTSSAAWFAAEIRLMSAWTEGHVRMVVEEMGRTE